MSASKSGRAITEMKARRLSAPARSKAVRRPDDVLRDVRGLKLRQRVSLVLNDKVLREELEDIVENFVHNGPRPASEGIRTYQDFLVPSYSGGMAGGMVTPIADIRGSDTLNYSKQERLLRCKLAAVYRLVDLFGWSIGIYGHITARASNDEDHYLLNPFGLLYNEVTASSLVKVDFAGNIVDGGSTNLGVNRAGLVLHSAVHSARKDIACVIHIHQPACVAVASTEYGILPITQEASMLGEIAYHDFRGILLDENEKDAIINELGEKSKVMVLRNHGMVIAGDTIEEAFMLAHMCVLSCEYQVRAMSAGVDNLIKVSEQVREKVLEVTGGENITDSKGSKWKHGELEFEAWMRMLDSRGYRTGYVYKNPEVFVSDKSQARDVTSPATTTSTRAQLFFTPDSDQKGVSRSHSTGRANTYRNRLKWLNTPVKSTEYKKDEDKLPEEKDESIIIKDQKPEKKYKDDVKEKVDDVIIQTKHVTVQESSPDFEKGAFDEEDREGVVHKKEVKQTTVVVTRVTDKDGERKEETKVTENKQVFIDGKEVEALKPPGDEDEDHDGEKSDEADHRDEADGEGSSPTADSPEPDSPTKPGQKVKKKKSFKDALKKKFSKRGRDDQHEETKKAE